MSASGGPEAPCCGDSLWDELDPLHLQAAVPIPLLVCWFRLYAFFIYILNPFSFSWCPFLLLGTSCLHAP